MMRPVWIVILAVCVACSSTTSTSEKPTTDPSPVLASDLARGWTLTAELGEFPFALTANETTSVIFVGRVSAGRDEPAAFWSSDGVSWEAASLPAAMVNSVVHMDGGRSGFVAATWDGSTPVVSHSTDGVDWDVIDVSTLPNVPILNIESVVARPDGFVITGLSRDTYVSFAWFSADGRAWVETDIPPIVGPLAVGASESGWMAVSAADEAGSSPAAVFTSADGVNWAPLETQTAPPASTLVRAFVPSLLVGAGDTWVLAVSGYGPPALWVSTDGGVNWGEGLSAANSSELEVADDFFSLEDAGDGFIVVGSLNGPDGDFLLFSRDGREWTRSRTDVNFRDLATLDEQLVAVDWVGNVYVWDGQQSAD